MMNFVYTEARRFVGGLCSRHLNIGDPKQRSLALEPMPSGVDAAKALLP
jgi:hypothetical protein